MSKGISEEEANKIMRRHSERLRGMRGVFSVGVEKDLSGEFLLKVGIEKEAGPIPTLPKELDGLKVIAEFRERPRKLEL